MRLDAVLLEPRVHTQLVIGVRDDLFDDDGELLSSRALDHPATLLLDEAVGCVHPVERLVRAHRRGSLRSRRP